MTDIRISVRNDSPAGGTFLTPFWFGVHDGSFDIYDLGAASSAGLEALAEDGTFDAINAELAAADADAIPGAVLGAAGPIATGELASAVVEADAASNGFIGLAAMLLPSNDAFIGTAAPLALFDEDGTFAGAIEIAFDGGSVRDAGTEVNTEMDAAFINQTGPNTGETEGGVVTVHPGFIGSEGNPGGDPIILGGTNAFGVPIDAVAADFTRAGAEVATIHINEAVETMGSDGRDVLLGSRVDDLVDAGDGRDLVLGRAGWDDIDGGAGNDKVFGNAGSDVLTGGDGDDLVSGGRGDDVIAGGAGDDNLRGGLGDDTIVFSEGDGDDLVLGFDRAGDDVIVLDVDGIDSFADVLDAAGPGRGRVTLDFGDGDALTLVGVRLGSLDESDFAFV